MDKFLEKANKILNLMSLENPRLNCDTEHRRLSIFVDDPLTQNQIAVLLGAFDHLFNLMLKKEDQLNYIVDLNYYRKERERLILELARAAAHKAALTKSEVELPPMNAYERRLVHVEITTHPELKTESVGIGRERRVVIKLLS